jgi:hypothetical protein
LSDESGEKGFGVEECGWVGVNGEILGCDGERGGKLKDLLLGEKEKDCVVWEVHEVSSLKGSDLDA